MPGAAVSAMRGAGVISQICEHSGLPRDVIQARCRRIVDNALAKAGYSRAARRKIFRDLKAAGNEEVEP